ncbi:hypothetical protein GCM10011339_01910 [Echinicola rosea]|uniref:DUF3784 domain-containing protein n=2 Tax=Echinicola rosea TaxID=1807691 RepID=A0ABQ1UIX3_9BACT|nr:hypothetical protein GCM10011339_01910 [Echinicola rosea]
MVAGFNYALYKYLKTIPERKNQNITRTYNQFEKSVKVAKPLRIIGTILFMALMTMWLDIVKFKYESYFSLLVMAILLSYVLLGVIFIRKASRF